MTRTPEQIAQCARGELITFLDYPQGTEGPIRERLVPIDEIPEEKGFVRPHGDGCPTILRKSAPCDCEDITMPLTPTELKRRYPKAARKAGIQ